MRTRMRCSYITGISGATKIHVSWACAGRRIGRLIENNINLFAFHLPLDGHPEIGNNVELGRRLGLQIEGRSGEQDLIFHGAPDVALTLGELAQRIEERLERKPMVIGDPARPLRRVAWCTGAAQGFLEEAVRVQADARHR